jgi:Ca2+-binding RTX toxin-like protein
VDAAIKAWQGIIQDFNYTDHSNTFTLNFYTRASVRGLGGQSYFASRYDATGKPMEGDILIESGTDGHGAGWWLDPTPTDSGEFLGNIINPYAGDATPGSPAVGKSDLFTLAVHEISHALGLTADPASAFQQDVHHYLTPTGCTDQAFHAGKLWLFRGPSVQALFTSYNRVSPGSDSGRPTHTAEPANTFTDAGGVRYYGSEDANNALFEYGRRYLPSYLDALILHDAYGYTLAPVEAFASFHSVLNQTTGELRIRGGATGASGDVITIGREGNQITVAETVGVPVPGTGPARPLFSRYDVADVRSIVVRSGDGNGRFRLEATPAGIPLNLVAGNGDNTIDLAPTTRNLDRLQGRLTLQVGAGSNSLILHDEGSTTGHAYSISSNSFTRNGSGAVTFSGIKALTIQAGSGSDTFTVLGLPAGATVSFQGDGGSDKIVGPNTANTWRITGQNSGSLNGSVKFTGVENLQGGSGPDVFVLADYKGVAGVIDGGGGTNTLDYSAYRQPIIVNLTAGTATNVGRGIRGIQNVLGGAGNDVLIGDGANNILCGGPGNDIIYGIGGNNVLCGSGGNDTLVGGSGRDILIGGPGADVLKAGDGGDILVAGSLAFDTDLARLGALLAEWSRTDLSFGQRIDHLLNGGGLNVLDGAPVLLNAGMVLDGGRNTLIGGRGQDWFWGTIKGDLADSFVDVSPTARIQ